MKKITLSLIGFGALALVPLAASAQAIKIDGSSTVYPITEAVAEEFQVVKKASVKVTVGISGTGGGFKKFCRGEIDIANASRPILKAEMELCKAAGIDYIELPIAYDALTVIVHKDNAFLKSITVAELKKMWEPAAQGKIMKWNQVNPAWPGTPMKLFGAGSDSGTFDYFTEAIVGKAKSSRGDYTASEDDNVIVQGVARDKGAIGYFGYAYYAENKDQLKAIPVVAKDGAPAVGPSDKTVEDGSYQPLSRPIFIYVKAKSLERAEMQEFVAFYLKNAAKLTKEVRYIALPKSAYELAAEHVSKKKIGTVFGGTAEVGVRIEELMKREGKL